MTPGRERLVFWCAALALWLLFVFQAFHTPVLLDDWYQLTFWRNHEFGLSAIWEYGHYNYFHFNPRIGDVLLAIVNGPQAIHVIVTPLVQLAVLPVTFAIAFARWPKPTLRDLQLLIFIQAMLWVVMPIPGVIYFYRPFATNYLWAFTITCTLLVPYRIALARAVVPRWPWLAPLLFVWGWLAGMCNEHTGPTAMVAIAVFVYVAYKRKQLRAWMIAGALGLYIGYPMLFFAPGQAVRYAGIATRDTPLHLLGERGFDGCFEILLDFVGESANGIALFVIGVLVYLRSFARRSVAVPVIPAATLWSAVVLILTSGAIVVTLFASPTASERLFYASAALLVAAFTAIAGHLYEDRTTRRFWVAVTTLLVAYHAFRFIQTYVDVADENDERLAILHAAPAGSVAHVPPYDYKRRTRWHWGDDFRYASLREYVANEVYDLHNIEYTDHLRWSQPSPPDHSVAERVYDPPLPAGEAAKVAPVSYIPSYWEWAIVQFRRLLVKTDIANHDGHKLVRYTVKSVGLPFEDPLHRPIIVLDWTPSTGFQFIDGRSYDDPNTRPWVRVWSDSVPKRLTETWVIACGTQRKVELVPDDDEHVGPKIPIALTCRGEQAAVMCEPDRCWLAGRYWR